MNTFIHFDALYFSNDLLIDIVYLVQHFLENSAARLPDKVALICGDQRLTYKEINQGADQLAAHLIDVGGIKRQDRVAIFLDNSAESVIALFGILKAGAIFIMLNASLKAKKLNYILKDCGARTLIAHFSKAQIIKDAIRGVPELKDLVWVGNPLSLVDKELTVNNCLWNEIMFQPQAPSLKPFGPAIDIDLAAIIYTSGSAGKPKGVMSSHCSIVSAARSIIQYLENVEDDIILNALPLSFDYGLYQVLMTFCFGGTVILEKSFSYPYRVIERLIQEKASGFPIVPTMLATLLQMKDFKKTAFSSLRYISSTASAMPVDHIKKLKKFLPHVKVYSMYGLTECKRVSYLPPEELDFRPDSVGIPMPNVEVFVIDEHGFEVGPNEVGELVVRGSTVMQGYWNSPQETKLRFRPGKCRGETLLYTGDLFRRDEDGFLYFVGRSDDMIKTRDALVSPKEIENCLCELEEVVEAVVIGVPDDIFGQAIKAVVVVNNNQKVTDKKIFRHCQQNLEPFMVPKYVEFRDRFEKMASGKIDKKKLK